LGGKEGCTKGEEEGEEEVAQSQAQYLGSSNDIDENSAEWDILWRTSEESSILRSSNGDK
jgi:hypothetical protein